MVQHAKYSGVNQGKAPTPQKAAALLLRMCEIPPASKEPLPDLPVVLYGAGNLGMLARDYLRQIGRTTKTAVDASPSKHRANPFWDGVDILSPEEVEPATKERSLLLVCVVTAPFAPIYASLRESGWLNVMPFYDYAENFTDLHPLGNGWYSGGLDSKDLEMTSRVLDLWADDLSRAHHLEFIAWHYSRQEWEFEDAPVTTGDRYFIPEVASALRRDEVFLDIGAHHGEVVEKFAEIAERTYSQIVAIEPDLLNLAQMRINLERSGLAADGRVRVEPVLVGSTEEKAPFHAGLGYASKISPTGAEHMAVKRIDDLGVAPTFMKLHIEGHELDALIGAELTVAKSRPIITATCYHDRKGIWQFADYLLGSLKDYKFIFRIHGWCGTGAVVYCLPNERLTQQGK